MFERVQCKVNRLSFRLSFRRRIAFQTVAYNYLQCKMRIRQFLINIGRQLGSNWSILVGALTGFLFGYLILTVFPDYSVISRVENMKDISELCSMQNSVVNKNWTKSKDMDKLIDELQKKKSLLAAVLFKETRLLCWVMTEPKRVIERVAIMETWGKRCQSILFMTGAKEMARIENSRTNRPNSRRQIGPNAFIVYLDMEKDLYENLWSKTRLAFAYIYEYLKNDYDWVLKVDDDSFVIIENLRLFLRGKKLEDPFYYGCQYKRYASGGPGYILSRINVDKFVSLIKRDQNSECSLNSKANDAEDILLATCLGKLGIRVADTRDESGRFRFSPFTPEMTINHETLPQKYQWFWSYSAHPLANGFECCSDNAISFHYITPSMMRVMEYLIYYIHPFSSRKIWNDTYFA